MKKLYILLLFCLLIGSSAISHTKEDRIAFLKVVEPIARQVEKDTGIKQKILIYHIAIESHWGTSRVCREANNYFGVKAHEGDPYITALRNKKVRYKVYGSLNESVQDWVKILHSSRYKNLLKAAQKGSYRRYRYYLVAEGYMEKPIPKEDTTEK